MYIHTRCLSDSLRNVQGGDSSVEADGRRVVNETGTETNQTIGLNILLKVLSHLCFNALQMKHVNKQRWRLLEKYQLQLTVGLRRTRPT